MCLSVNKCCCFIGLDRGTKIIGVLHTVLAACTVGLYGTAAALGRLPETRLVFYSAMTICGLLEFVFGCLLVRAAYKKRPQHLWPWLGLCWAKAVALIVLTLAGVTLVAVNSTLETTPEVSIVISVYFVYALLLLYFTSVVNSRRQEMVLENYWVTKRLLQHAKNQYYYV